ncbi:MAG: hypothetical protein DWQ04_32080 [Chloroflexi bacterium]|nr:MAG: hypothetical protein DWQ04_32080 [Chloroflexota bacterium]
MAKKDQARARAQNESGLASYQAWNMADAINAFSDAIEADEKNPEYRLNLARAYARNGDFDQAMQALGEYLQTETKQDIATRFEKLFSTALDPVEEIMITKMREIGMSMQETGKGIQMWLEYRITIGRRPLRIPKPELWAAALTYAISKVNFVETKRKNVAKAFDITEKPLKEKYDELVETLDIMPADYRYFTGEKNPLDKLVEAAQLLENLDEKFKADE